MLPPATATNKTLQQHGPLLNGLMAGIGSLCARTLFAPTRRIQIVLLTAPGHPLVRSGSIRPFRDPLDIVDRLVRSGGGPQTLWEGHTVQLAKGVVRGVYSLGVVRRVEPLLQRGAAGALLAGSLGTALLTLSALIIENPFDVVYTCIASDLTASTFTGPWDCVKMLVERGGVGALFDGLAMQLVGLAATHVVRAVLRRLDPLPPQHVLRRQSLFRRYMRAQIMVLSESAAQHPFVVVRERMMTRWAWDPMRPQFRGNWDCIKRIWDEYGWRGFWSGVGWSLAYEHFPVLLLSLPGTDPLLNEITNYVAYAMVSSFHMVVGTARTVLRITTPPDQALATDEELAAEVDEDVPEVRIRRSRSAVW